MLTSSTIATGMRLIAVCFVDFLVFVSPKLSILTFRVNLEHRKSMISHENFNSQKFVINLIRKCTFDRHSHPCFL